MSRFLIAAAHKSSGKTVISTGLTAALTARGLTVQTFKKGPDYIDPMWLSAASGRGCYNLDFNSMDRRELLGLFGRKSNGDISLVEANKGLFDGVNVDGSDSNAELAKLLKTPVVLVVDTQGMTRGIAPLLMGYQAFDPDVNIAGIILNKVGGSRHEGKLRNAVETYTDIPVFGAVSHDKSLDIGERHLGLTTPAETGEVQKMITRFGEIVGGSVDLERLINCANAAEKLPGQPTPSTPTTKNPVRIAIAQDTAFGFYYQDDLEAFANAGAELVPVNMISGKDFPAVDGLFIGGGFPETQAQALSDNTAMRAQVKAAIKSGLPCYAECGGLMYLCESIRWQDDSFPMVGVVPGDAQMCARPQGRGYAGFGLTENNPWSSVKDQIKAHEFHYARIDNLPTDIKFARTITRGHGTDGQNDGIVMGNLLAGFCHLRHSKANPWVDDFVDFVRRHKKQRP